MHLGIDITKRQALVHGSFFSFTISFMGLVNMVAFLCSQWFLFAEEDWKACWADRRYDQSGDGGDI
jgi:hypothetical protein